MNTLKNIKPNKEKAIFMCKRQLPELVCDAVNLEGINYTLPEVQTLLENITVGGHKVSDQMITINQANSWRHLFTRLEDNQLSLSKNVVCELHAIAGHKEALEWGKFRSGGVTIAGTDYMPPSAKDLDARWDEMLSQASSIQDIFDKAIFVFLQMARNQFFYDVNKRMGRFMMNGILLDAGYPAINLSVKRKVEFNQLMLEFYPSNDVGPMTAFMKSCLEQKVIDIMSEN